MASLDQIQADIVKIRAEIAVTKSWLAVHQWVWLIVAFFGGIVVAKLFL